MNQLYTFDEILEIVNNSIQNIKYSQKPDTLFEPISYILSLGGKRIRPALALMSYNLYCEDVAKALPVANGIEVFHNFTLLHDDLMDKACKRRGEATVHIKWSENTAILSGDAMLIEAYKETCKVDKQHLATILDLFSITASEICCGQQYDMEFEHRMDVTISEYIEMIRLKTAVLLGCALKEGAMVAGAPSEDADNLYNFGINIGLAFQLKDDLLDVYGNPETFGKRIGGDIISNKKTYLLINALSNSSTRDEISKWISKTNFDEEEKIKAVKDIYNELNLKEKSEVLIDEYYNQSIAFLNKVKVDKKRKHILYKVAEDLMYRNS